MIEYLVVLGGLLLLPPQNETEVSADLDRSTAEVGETVILTVRLRASSLRSPEIESPQLGGFEILATSDRSSFRFSTAAGAVREFSRQYTLRVEKAGRLTIPPLRVSIDGMVYETETLLLEAVEPSGFTQLPGRLEPKPGVEVAVRLWVEPETAYVGQQVTMTVAAFFDPLVRNRLQRQPEYRPPEVQGFWTADLPGPIRPTRRLVGDREYFVQVYRRALFPLSPGRVRIPAAAVIYEVRRGLIYAPETFHVESSPVTVTVLPTPERGRPPGFAGAVGQYEADVSFDRANVAAGEAVNLILEVSGSGNLRAFPRPILPEVAGLRAYEGAEEAETQTRGTQLGGRKRFSWVLIPERAGQYIIPEIDLPYFDPVTDSYHTTRTEPMTLEVARAPSLSSSVASGGGRSAMRFIKDRPARQPLDLHQRPGFWVTLAVPLAVLLGVGAVGRSRRAGPSRRRSRRRRARSRIRELRPLAESGDASFFSALRGEVLGYLRARLCLPSLPEQGIVQTQHALEDAGVSPAVTIEIIELLELCGRYHYSPQPPGEEERWQLLRKAEKLLATVDREAVSEKRLQSLRESGARGTLALGLLVVSAMALHAQGSGAVANVDRWFKEGVTEYSRGDYAAAAESFEKALAARPRDANVQYNLGNSYYGMGEEGRAVAMWMNALKHKPRDADARYNLLLAVGDDPVLGSSLPPVPLSEDETAILLALLWLVGCGAIIARQRWRSGLLTVGGVTAAVLAVATAAILMLPRADYAVVVSTEAALRAGPVAQSEALAFPAPGTGYRVEERRGPWLRVTRGGDSEGWVNEREVEVIGQRSGPSRGS